MEKTHCWKVTWITTNGTRHSTDLMTEKDARFMAVMMESYTLLREVEAFRAA